MATSTGTAWPEASASPPRESVQLADIFAEHGESFRAHHRLPPQYLRVMWRIEACRTEVLGGQVRWCEDCDFEQYVYHSCRDRHCPKCQTQAKEQWREARQAELLPVPYFHQVFTLPHEVNCWILASERNQRVLLELLFASVSATLHEFGQGELGGQVGFTLVLHTWDQRLRPHFHLHVLIASGAVSADRSRWIAGGNDFLFPVRALSKMFRGKFLAGFETLEEAGKLDRPRAYRDDNGGPGQAPTVTGMLRRLRRKSWVIYSKPPFAGPAKLLDYLSRYTHRVAISNDRILACQDGEVTFAYRDRSDGDRRKEETIPAETFIGRFLSHVLPRRLMRIRHYGFLANRYRHSRLTQIRQLLGARPVERPTQLPASQWLEQLLGIDPNRCPCCGGLLQQRELPPQRAPDRPPNRSMPGESASPTRASRGPPGDRS